MSSNKISSLSKNDDFRFLLKGKKISNKYFTIFFDKMLNKNNKNLNISFVVKKKFGNALKKKKSGAGGARHKKKKKSPTAKNRV